MPTRAVVKPTQYATRTLFLGFNLHAHDSQTNRLCSQHLIHYNPSLRFLSAINSDNNFFILYIPYKKPRQNNVNTHPHQPCHCHRTYIQSLSFVPCHYTTYFALLLPLLKFHTRTTHKNLFPHCRWKLSFSQLFLPKRSAAGADASTYLCSIAFISFLILLLCVLRMHSKWLSVRDTKHWLRAVALIVAYLTGTARFGVSKTIPVEQAGGARAAPASALGLGSGEAREYVQRLALTDLWDSKPSVSITFQNLTGIFLDEVIEVAYCEVNGEQHYSRAISAFTAIGIPPPMEWQVPAINPRFILWDYPYHWHPTRTALLSRNHASILPRYMCMCICVCVCVCVCVCMYSESN